MMFFQSGTDGKPLHAGLAARNGVWAYELLQHTSLQTSTKPFGDTVETAAKHGIAAIIQPGVILSKTVDQYWAVGGDISGSLFIRR